MTHCRSFCRVAWVIYWKGRLRNVILEPSNLANLNPSPKVRQRERSHWVYYIPMEKLCGKAIVARASSFYIIIIRHGVGYLCCLSQRWRQCESQKTWDERK